MPIDDALEDIQGSTLRKINILEEETDVLEERTKLSKEELFSMFPYLEKEMTEYAAYANYYLESAEGIQGKSEDFPDTYAFMNIYGYEAVTNTTRVDFINDNKKVFKSLRLPEHNFEGDKTDEVLKSMDKKPWFIVVKNIEKLESSENFPTCYTYNIEVYDLKSS